MNKQKYVLDHGRVTLIDIMGDDYRILESARISTGAEPSKGEEKDRGLIRYLYKNEHLTPMEQVVTTWRIKAPLFVVQQLLRHRSSSFNQMSSRYTELPQEHYTPEVFQRQSTSNHQGADEPLDPHQNEQMQTIYNELIHESYNIYNLMVETADVAKEQARMILPVSQYTELYVTMNLRNLFHFLSLRMESHAQYEIRVFAEAMLEILREYDGLKWSVEVFEEFNELSVAYKSAINRAGKNSGSLLDYLNRFER